MSEYDLELDKLKERIVEKGYRNILLQFPDGDSIYMLTTLTLLE